MRLTLRTLLAYLDQNLGPDDAKEIGKKVQESEFATNLMHRIRDCMRRLRLGAPGVTDRGAGLDPNTVAEYLDNTLPDSQVPDFEKVCLESEVHLAEVASCHQILTLVLGEPAEIDPDARQHMYRLPEQLAAAAELPGEAAAAGAAAAPSDGRGRAETVRAVSRQEKKSRVPDYLRESRPKHRLGRWVAAAVLILLAAVAGFLCRDQVPQIAYDLGLNPLGGEPFGDHGGQQSPSDKSGVPASTPGQDNQSAGPEGIAKTEKPAATEPSAGPSSNQAKTSKASGGGSSDVADIAIREPGPVKPAPVEQKSGPPAPGPPAPGPIAPPDGGKVAAGGEQGLAPPRPKAEHLAGVPGLPGIEKPNVSGLPLPPALEGPPKVAQPVGQLATPRDVLLSSDNGLTRWQRVSDQAPITSGVKLLSLPVFRPIIQLTGGTRLQLVDGTLIEFQPPALQRTALAMEYGRLLCKAEEGAGSSVQVQIGDRSGVVTLPGTDSVFVLEVSRADGSGADPETQPGPIVADLFAVNGKITWQDARDGKPVSLIAPYRLSLNDRSGDRRSHELLPGWLRDDSVSRLELDAADTVHRELDFNRSANTRLRELLTHRKKEVRWLAVRCLAYVGDFEPLVNALNSNDPEQKLLWSDYIDELRAAVIRSPQTAGQVRAAMETRLGSEQGANLYEMLWRYRPGMLKPEDAPRLVKFLDDETLAIRVLSFWNLKNLSRDPNRDSSHGLTFSYRPEDSPTRRQPAIQRWTAYVRNNPLVQGKIAAGDENSSEPAKAPPKRAPAAIRPVKPSAESVPPPAESVPSPGAG